MPTRVLEIAVKLADRIVSALPGRSQPQNRPQHLLTAEAGEDAAYFYLSRLGYRIVARRYHSSRVRGDIDLIGWDGDVLCFVEVKTRTTRSVMPAEAAVNHAKKRYLSRLAQEYLRRLPVIPAFRFDILSVYCENQTSTPEFHLYKNAFPLV
ncbi:MAG TPA: YraN family protein [Terriglobales bacterium]|nr:YraN family protein [Terriglobales bacterium]